VGCSGSPVDYGGCVSVADRGKCRSAITENVGVPVAWDGFWVMVVQGLAITS
jgi:hypothetical protein